MSFTKKVFVYCTNSVYDVTVLYHNKQRYIELAADFVIDRRQQFTATSDYNYYLRFGSFHRQCYSKILQHDEMK